MTATGQQVDIQGHRGARGLMPENTIPAMIKAIDLGVTTLELDVVITKDRQVVLSHEPHMSGLICLTPSGERIAIDDHSHNIYQLTYEQVKQYDCGSIGNAGFPIQVKLHTSKPLLKDMIQTVEKYVKDHGLKPVRYNIEIKSTVEGDNIYHPDVTGFSSLVYDLISRELDWERVTIQSFDFRVLSHFRVKYPDVQLAMLVANDKTWEQNVQDLGFTPEIYSPYYKMLDASSVKQIQQAGMLVIPWTVNAVSDMKMLLEWDVDGIITDYPDRAKGL